MSGNGERIPPIAAAMLAGVLLFAGLPSAKGGYRHWVVNGSGWWATFNNWSTSPYGVPNGAPQDGDYCYIAYPRAGDYAVWYNGSASNSYHLVWVDNEGGGTAELLGAYGYILNTSSLYLGYVGKGKGTLSWGTWNTDDAYLGYSGGSRGDFDFLAGAFNCNTLFVGQYGDGNVAMTGGTTTVNGFVYLGLADGTRGTFTQSGGTTAFGYSTGHPVYVGMHGTGFLNVHGGTCDMAGTAYVGRYGSSTGSMLIADTHAAVDVSCYSIYLGYEGEGTLTVGEGSNGTEVSVAQDVRMGLVAGSAAELELNGGTLNIGGNLLDGDGASILRVNSSSSGSEGLQVAGTKVQADQLYIGKAGTAGSLYVRSGQDATFSDVTVGDGGAGFLFVYTDASLTVQDDLFVADTATGYGTVRLYGGTTYVEDLLSVGYLGQGDLYVGADLTVNGALVVGHRAGSEGIVDLSMGALVSTDTLAVGGYSSDGGEGTVLIGPDAELDVSIKTEVHPDGQIILQGGTFRTSQPWRVYDMGGTFRWDAGTVHFTSNSEIEGTDLDLLLGPEHRLRPGQHLLCDGSSTMMGRLVLDGGRFSTETVSNAAAIDFLRGRLDITSGFGVAVTPAGLLGDHLRVKDDQHYHFNGALSIHSDGLAEMEGGKVSSDVRVSVYGTLCGEGEIDAPLQLQSGGELAVDDAQTLTVLSSGTSSSYGTIDLNGGTLRFTASPCVANYGRVYLNEGTLSTEGPFENDTDGYVFGRGTLRGRDGIDNRGAMAFSNGATDIHGDLENAAAGLIMATGGATVTFYDDVGNAGEIRTSADCATVFLGDVSGAGTFSGIGTNYFEGDLQPGSSPGHVSFGGDVVFGVSSRCWAELAGDDPLDRDLLLVSGEVSLSGQLRIELTEGYVPEPGSVIEIITAEAVGGDFLTQDELGTPAGLWFERIVDANSVSVLATALMGDINVDGKVSLADLSALAANWGSTDASWFTGDLSGDDRVSLADLSALAGGWGASLPPSGAGEVPEPATLGLIGIGGLVFLLRPRRRQ
ncbi:MAG: PEP-CTERM sorting domain-containing protein [Phycisphaerae bacterium]